MRNSGNLEASHSAWNIFSTTDVLYKNDKYLDLNRLLEDPCVFQTWQKLNRDTDAFYRKDI